MLLSAKYILGAFLFLAPKNDSSACLETVLIPFWVTVVLVVTFIFGGLQSNLYFFAAFTTLFIINGALWVKGSLVSF